MAGEEGLPFGTSLGRVWADAGDLRGAEDLRGTLYFGAFLG